MSRYVNSSCRQRGAVLVISLVFLLLLTVLGVAAMKSSTLQERMAGNSTDANFAFQAAEYGLKQAEWVLGGLGANSALPTFGSSPGTVAGYTLMIQSATNAAYWQTFDWGTNALKYSVPNASGPPSQVFVMVEQFAAESAPMPGGPSIKKGALNPSKLSVLYRVTSKGLGPTGNSPVVLQEMYGRGS